MTTQQFIIALILAMSTLLTAMGSLIVSLRNSRKIEEVHKSTNGKMEMLLEQVRTASIAKGKKEEKDNPT